MPCTLATVHMQDLAGDEGRVLQIEDRVYDVVDLAETTDRMQFRQGVVGRRIVHRRADYPRATALERMPRPAYSTASALVTAFSPPLVSDANAEGTAELAWSTRLVEMFTM